MKVLFLTDGIFPFKIGGMQKHSLILARLLAKNKVYVHLVHCAGEGYSKAAFKALFDASEIGFISETVIPFPKTDPFPGHYIRENKMYSKNAFLELEDRIGEFDLIYAQGFSGWRFIKEKHKKNIEIPIFVNFHGLEMYQSAPSLKVMAEYTLFKNSVKWNLRNADFAYSFGGRIDQILKDVGVREDRVLQHSNGIEDNWLHTEPTQNNKIRKFVFVGRAERRKGIEELKKVLEHLIKKDEKFEFSFIGPINDKLKVIDERITYHGEIRDPEAIKKLLRQQDCLVCPSHSEGMPTVILEAMACGLVIVGTNVGAVEKQIQGNGILLEKPDVKILEEALLEILSMSDVTLREYKLNSLALVKSTFLWDKVVAQKMKDFRKSLPHLQLD